MVIGKKFISKCKSPQNNAKSSYPEISSANNAAQYYII